MLYTRVWPELRETNKIWCNVSGRDCVVTGIWKERTPGEEGGYWGNKYPNLIFLLTSIFYWFLPLVKPNQMPKGKGAGCVHLGVNVLQPKTSRNTAVIDQLGLLLIGVDKNAHPREPWGVIVRGCQKGFISKIWAGGG